MLKQKRYEAMNKNLVSAVCRNGSRVRERNRPRAVAGLFRCNRNVAAFPPRILLPPSESDSRDGSSHRARYSNPLLLRRGDKERQRTTSMSNAFILQYTAALKRLFEGRKSEAERSPSTSHTFSRPPPCISISNIQLMSKPDQVSYQVVRTLPLKNCRSNRYLVRKPTISSVCSSQTTVKATHRSYAFEEARDTEKAEGEQYNFTGRRLKTQEGRRRRNVLKVTPSISRQSPQKSVAANVQQSAVISTAASRRLSYARPSTNAGFGGRGRRKGSEGSSTQRKSPVIPSSHSNLIGPWEVPKTETEMEFSNLNFFL